MQTDQSQKTFANTVANKDNCLQWTISPFATMFSSRIAVSIVEISKYCHLVDFTVVWWRFVMYEKG